MKPATPIVRRLREHDAREHGAHGRMGEIIRSMKRPPPLAAEANARVLRRLRFSGASRWERIWMARRPALAAVLALGVLFAGIGAHAGIARAVMAGLARIGVDHLELLAPPPERLARPAAQPSPASTVHPGAQPLEAPLVQNEPPAPPPETTVEDAPPAARRAMAKPNPAPAVEMSPLARESRLLGKALEQLRTAHDYTGALGTLAEYDARFPRGVLAREATLARLDALTALGQSEAALQLLEGLEMTGPRATEMLVLRGELRANAGRPRDAVVDFDHALGARLGRALHGRALYGRASCRARLGDVAGARRDLEDYATHFPEGPRAAEARHMLDR